MFTNLINRIVELATGRVVDAVDTLEVQTDATNRIVEYGLDYCSLAAEFDMSDLAGEIALSDLASEFDMCDLAREVVDDRDFREVVIDTIKDSSAFERMVDEAVENHVDSIEARMQEVEAKVAALAVAPTPDTAKTEPTAVEVPTNLTDRLLALAVERLLTLADEAARDGRV
jgi:hypothetical protein